MANVTAQMVKELRDRTQAGMADCKNALVESDGDMDKAVELILKKGIVKAAARAGRVASEGEVRVVVSADGKRATLVEVNCQTDFVARGDDFKGFVTACIEVASKLAKGADLLAQTYPGTSKTIETVRQEMVAKTGENTVVRRWDCLESKAAGGYVHAYVHMGGKNASIIEVEAPNADAAKSADFRTFVDNCAMQIVAMKPIVVKKEDLSQKETDKQKEIFMGQLKEEGKPEASWPKIVEGKIAKWYTEVTLLGQESVTDPGNTIDKLRAELGKKIGGDVTIKNFIRFELGEGIEKKADDFAEEVAKMSGVS